MGMKSTQVIYCTQVTMVCIALVVSTTTCVDHRETADTTGPALGARQMGKKKTRTSNSVRPVNCIQTKGHSYRLAQSLCSSNR
ncbi:hypothetical protein BDN67DRAFT_962607 [Paxillus ammoniavirescens]|nr:hypothetical protein BDN67DRAFT_962607 [Paxillus ammoniavirescens]